MGRIVFIGMVLMTIVGSETALAQRNEYNFITAGLTFRPIIPSNLLQTATVQVTGNVEDDNEYLRLKVEQRLGYSFGMVVRKNFTQRFAMETGVNFVRRGFDVEVTDLDSNVTSGVDFGISSYEVPLMALVYIRLGEQVYMNTALGLAAVIGARSVANNNREFDHFTAIRKFNGGVLANIGVEWRTKKMGSFYLGATYHQPTGPIADTKINHFRAAGVSSASIETPLNGTYLTIDVRYYFGEN